MENRSQCQENLREIGMAFMQYTQDYDEKYPPVAAARAGNWVGSMQPYLKTWQMFQCPTDEKSVPDTTDYFYNARLAKAESKNVKFPMATILAGDGLANQSTSYHLSQLPAGWLSDENSPAWRHLGAANYVFVDGHVKTLSPQGIMTDKSGQNRPTFEVKP